MYSIVRLLCKIFCYQLTTTNVLDPQEKTEEDISDLDLSESEVKDHPEENKGSASLENKHKNDYLEFIEKLFPKKRHDWILKDEDLISEEQSESRLTWFGITSSCILLLVVIAQCTHLLVILWPEKPPIIVQPDLPTDKFLRKFPIPHLVTVSKSGEVYDFSFAENVSPSRGFLFKLSKAEHYYAFSDQKGVLHFVDSQLKRAITRYHPKLNKQGHQIIQNSALDSGPHIYIQSLLINGFFWLFGQTEFGGGFQIPFPYSGSM